jgi:cell division protein FtsL
MIRSNALFITLFIVLAAASALGVISAQHEARKLHNALEQEQTRAQDLEVEWGRLQIEQSHLVAHRRVEEVARVRLGMTSPSTGQIVALEGRP